ncbi:hypothetical protein CA13_41510 [Planctomycetes bacterium CA13]|uniref:SnoaL-like domain-containing protein n=1 Tax=Novipirellula herctigrandis TaxID=2527986 RepID=A0A5C5Z5V6_9BACT|nr:hypothetical protein CA13_41510 [Planctomycetes bacterium CA13]
MISKKLLCVVAGVLVISSTTTVAQLQTKTVSNPSGAEQAVQARLAEIQTAAESLDPEKVFSFVCENDKGALIQNGEFLLTREEALQATKRGFENLDKITYRFDQQHTTLLSPTIALATAEGMSSVTTKNGRTFSSKFAQSVVLILADGEWKVFHAHRSFPPAN